MVATVAAGRAGELADSAVIEASWRRPEAFGALHERYAGALYRYAFRRVGAVAEDVVAETFLAAFAQRRGYDLARSDARPWLFGILTRLIARWSRTEEIKYRAYARSAPAPDAEGLAERVSDQVSAQALRGQLAEALCRLRRGDRDVLLLVAWGQLSYDEVAEALGIPVGTVASRLARARRVMRQALGSADVSEGDRHG